MCKINIPEGATLDERRKIYFDTLYQINLNDKVEKKENLTYLTWSEAWKAFKSVYPSATFRVITHPEGNVAAHCLRSCRKYSARCLR